MTRLSVLSATFMALLFLGSVGCGATGKKNAPEAGVSGGATTLATGGLSSGGTVPVGSGGAGGASGGGLSGTGGTAGSGGLPETGGAASGDGLPGTGGTAGGGGLPGTGGAAGSGGLPGTGGTPGSGGTGTSPRMDAAVDGSKDAAQAQADLDADVVQASDCTGQADFTPCTVVTSPDRKYDICVAGTCVSPGCGDSTCNVPGPHFPLADTGELYCSYSTMGVCPASGQPYYGQDAQYGWDTTHAQSERYTQNMAVAGQPLVLDNVTGLAWTGCSAGLTGDTCATGTIATYVWEDAVAYCDALDWAGSRDWHLPDAYELNSISGTGWWIPRSDAAVLPFPGTYLWSSSSYARDSTYAWNGMADLSGLRWADKSTRFNVLCVRGGAPMQSARFARDTSVDAQPVVLDNVTGLTWQGCIFGLTGNSCATGTAGARTWQGALAYCEALSWAGKDDWRLPNIKELSSIVDVRHYDPAIDTTVFPGVPAPVSGDDVEPSDWSSSSLDGDGWDVSFAFDGSYSSPEAGASPSGHVRCVRGGL
jgi:Protein of unknown function (DUF1566)